MNQTIWYCMEDEFIFPDEASAREGYRQWLRENTNEDDFDEEIFNECYKEITFEEYNKLRDEYNED